MAEPGLALVVDDHPTNRLLAATMLGKLGWRVHEAENGETAIGLAEAHDFQLVLLDISMPGLSGEDTCARLRQLPRTSPLKIIAYTAHAFPEDRSRILSGGFDDILVKPVGRLYLAEVLDRL